MPTPVNFELGLLPERKTDWRALVGSYAIQVLLILLLLSLRLLWPERLELIPRGRVTELIPPPVSQSEPPRIETRALPVQAPPPVIVRTPKLVVPKDLPRPKPLPEIEPPQIEADFKPPQLKPASTSLPKVVYTGSFGSSATATLNAAVQQVQTGGFGDPDGLKGQGKDNAHLPAAKVGAFDLPDGAGRGNGVGGAKGAAGTVASAGFGSGIAITDSRSSHATVQTAGFGAQEISHAAAKPMLTDGPPTTPVEILAKPNPVYTEEARQLKIEGEVLLEVTFGANGQLHVNRVVRGLGHGLDESALAAAGKIQFKPAARDGSPVDSTAIVHVTFQLAY